MNTDIEKQVMDKIFWRLLPLLISLYIISYLDRVNVGFAAWTMNADIGLSTVVFGWGAGLFFIGYCLFEVSSNLMMVKVGARRWIARILFHLGLDCHLHGLCRGAQEFPGAEVFAGGGGSRFFPSSDSVPEK